MKVCILAGGFGTRLSEETDLRPKPMVEIGGKPILWHVMKCYSLYGFNEFVILLGYKGHVIRDYFLNYFYYSSDITVDLNTNEVSMHNNFSESWKVTLLDTGLNSMTGARIKKAKNIIGCNQFLLTYGDGVADINVSELVAHHKKSGKLCTMTCVQPEGRFGSVNIINDSIYNFNEKPKGDGAWVNGGFFVCEPEVFDYISESPDEVFEQNPLQMLAKNDQLNAFKHNKFWKCMDTLKDKKDLDLMYSGGNAPWKKW